LELHLRSCDQDQAEPHHLPLRLTERTLKRAVKLPNPDIQFPRGIIMATNPQAAAPMLPPLYKSLAPISTSAHAGFGMKLRDHLLHAAGLHAIPITVDEFATAHRFYPIIFASGEMPQPLALVGLSEGQNLFLSAEGKWREGCYVPAYVRRYPFMLARLRPESAEMTLCFDDSYADIGEGVGEKLFDNGEATQVTKDVLSFCEQFEQSLIRTKLFVEELMKGGLLMDGEVKIQQDGMPEPATYRGFRMVNEDKIKELRGDQARKLVQNGSLPLMYAHLMSLPLISELFMQAKSATAY
jgi:hypothetical protein